ncbi:glutathione S-transferase family protein [uncultured Litoreibacter sp.]|uniref:glutathione S-transferase family protein n=1 Tax=uncultured Litoreibacter sp. TaxID=1392394 RepID=UPI002619F9E9|nr:glutathione S-transferase family protein [uncultured Litoreibacter sp.]
MTLTLSTISGSPRGWRVLLGMAFKGLTPEINELKLSEKEHKKEPFISLNPRGTVPTLECDGVVIRDSVAILAWLDRKFPEKPIFGERDEEAAQIWQTTMEVRQYIRQAAAGFLTPVFFGGASLDDKGTAVWDDLTAVAEVMQMEMCFLNDLLSDGRNFLSGATPSAADALAWPDIRLVQRASETKPDLMAELGFAELANTLDHLEGWKQRVFECPGVKATMPGHW